MHTLHLACNCMQLGSAYEIASPTFPRFPAFPLSRWWSARVESGAFGEVVCQELSRIADEAECGTWVGELWVGFRMRGEWVDIWLPSNWRLWLQFYIFPASLRSSIFHFPVSFRFSSWKPKQSSSPQTAKCKLQPHPHPHLCNRLFVSASATASVSVSGLWLGAFVYGFICARLNSPSDCLSFVVANAFFKQIANHCLTIVASASFYSDSNPLHFISSVLLCVLTNVVEKIVSKRAGKNLVVLPYIWNIRKCDQVIIII